MLNLLSNVVSLGGLNVALIDLVVLGIIFLAVLFGAVRGFLRQVLSILGVLAALVLAVLLCKSVGTYIYEKVPFITDKVAETVNKIFSLDQIIAGGGKEEIIAILQTTKIPSFLHSLVADYIIDSGAAMQLSQVLTQWALVAISFIAIFILSFIVFFILKRICKFITSLKGVGTLDKILGAIFMVAKVIVILILVCMVASIFTDTAQYLTPTLEDGKVINSVFNQLVTKIMESGIIKKMFI